MERGEGSYQIPNLNEVYVVDVKPLRTIPPIFVDGWLQSGFLPSGEEPYITNDDLTSSLPPKMVSTLNNNSSFTGAGSSHDPIKISRGRPKASQSTKKKWQTNEKLEAVKPRFQNVISREDRGTGNRELVSSLLMRFDALRRRLSQVDIAQGDIDVAVNTFKFLELHTNANRRIGSIPGIDVGDIFFCWGEMGVVGLHVAPIGVEFMDHGEEKLVAIGVVSTGKNADKTENPDCLVFTGYGGTNRFKGAPSDQKMAKANLSLEKAMKLQNPVRVIRHVADKMRTNGKIYIYDGVYRITTMWEETNKDGYKVFKFMLMRDLDQKPGFEIWKSVESWRTGLVTRPDVVLEDLSYGVENLKIPLVNEVDGEKDLAIFTYLTSLHHSVTDGEPTLSRCTCLSKSCCLGSWKCRCIERNGGEFPYIFHRVLVTRRPMVYECGDSCWCSAECEMKIIPNGIKFSLEVFKTVDCGWGLRSWDPIRGGSFICEFAGEVIKKGDEEDDEYVFDSSRICNSFQWNYEPELVDENDSDKVSEVFDLPEPLVINAKKSGNIARFMNHGCTPNVLWQPILRVHNGKLYIHIGFFALKHIPPLAELRYDYGISGGRRGKKKCLCESEKCRGSFG